MDAWNILVEFPLILMIKDDQKSNPIRCFFSDKCCHRKNWICKSRHLCICLIMQPWSWKYKDLLPCSSQPFSLCGLLQTALLRAEFPDRMFLDSDFRRHLKERGKKKIWQQSKDHQNHLLRQWDLITCRSITRLSWRLLVC